MRVKVNATMVIIELRKQSITFQGVSVTFSIVKACKAEDAWSGLAQSSSGLGLPVAKRMTKPMLKMVTAAKKMEHYRKKIK